MADPISGTVEKSNGGNVIKETFEVTPEGVKQARNDIPVGVGGSPIDRIPLNPRLVAKVNAGEYSAKIASTDRCIRLVTVPLKGGTEGTFHCSRACVSQGTDGARLCPEHDKAAFLPNQDHPSRPGRTFNSASIELTAAEKTITFEKDGKKQTVTLEDGADVSARRDAPANSPAPVPPRAARRRSPAPAGPRAKKEPNTVTIRLTLEELGSGNCVNFIREKLVEAINGLPAKTISDMESTLKVREHVKNELTYQEEGK